jgi:hypothetical protein
LELAQLQHDLHNQQALILGIGTAAASAIFTTATAGSGGSAAHSQSCPFSSFFEQLADSNRYGHHLAGVVQKLGAFPTHGGGVPFSVSGFPS